VLFAASPLISAFLAGGIASALGCPTLNEGSTITCQFMGTDIGETLTGMFVLGWLGFVTLPIGGFLLIGWFVVLCLVRVATWRRRRSAA
jgi:hypothetical protein